MKDCKASSAITELSELIGDRYAVIAAMYLATAVHEMCNARDITMLAQYPLGFTPEQIAAHREATRDLRDLADRWDGELAAGDLA